MPASGGQSAGAEDGLAWRRPPTSNSLLRGLGFATYNDSMETDVAIKIGERVREFREKKGLSLRDFSRETGFNYNMMSRIERGELNMTLHTLIRLTRCLKITPAKLFRGLK